MRRQTNLFYYSQGEACGLVKNMALLAHITTDEANTRPIERLCHDLGVEDARRMTGEDIHAKDSYLVFLNGLILGLHKRPQELVDSLRMMRRRGLAGEFVSVYFHEEQRAVHLATDGGRVCRPLIIVDYNTGQPKLKQCHVEALAMKTMTVRDLLNQGIVEYVDCNEENNTLIAVTEKDLEIAIKNGLDNIKMRYTHLEIDPFTVLGVVGGIIPVSVDARINCCLSVGETFSNLVLNFIVCHSFRITTSRLETHTPLRWRNKRWELFPSTSMNGWMGLSTPLYTHRSRSSRVEHLILSTSTASLEDRMPV